MKLLKSILLSSLFSAPAQAAWVMPTENLACTADINPWGVSSSCACPHGLPYNEKIGQCLTGEPYPIMISGSLRSEDALNKGVFIDTQVGVFKIIVKTAELEKLQSANGYYFEVEGEFLLLNKESVIVADRLSWLE